jgi:hypothetical protein
VLDPRVRKALLDYQAGTCELEDAAQMLLQVRRETGCLELQAPPGTAPRQQQLVARFNELVKAEFGA